MEGAAEESAEEAQQLARIGIERVGIFRQHRHLIHPGNFTNKFISLIPKNSKIFNSKIRKIRKNSKNSEQRFAAEKRNPERSGRIPIRRAAQRRATVPPEAAQIHVGPRDAHRAPAQSGI